MNMQQNVFSKKTIAIVTLFIALSMVLPMASLSTADAHTPAWTIESFAYVSVAPTPGSVGQPVYIYMWVDLPLSGAGVTNDIRRHNYHLTITQPDGTNKTETWDVVEDTTGVQAYQFTPEMAGNYTITFDYPEQTYTWSGDFNGDVHKAAQAVKTLEVTDEEIPNPLSSAPLPTEYWTRPINGANTAWFQISSNWLNAPYIRSGATATGGAGYGRYQPDGAGPETPHVMWTKAIQDGGVVGGTSTYNVGEGFYTGSSYNPRFANAIVMNGRLYYQEPYGNSGSGGDYIAVDLTTGEELWRIDREQILETGVPTFGYQYCFEDGNQHGVLPNGLLIVPYTVGGTPGYMGRLTGGIPCWAAYDARTGKLTDMNLTNVPSGSAASATLAANSANGASAAGPRGEYIIYQLANLGTTANPSYYLMQWNSSKYHQLSAGQIGAGNWYPTASFDASDERMYDWNVSLSTVTGQGWSIYRDVQVDNKLLLVKGSMGTGPRTEGTGADIICVSLDATGNTAGNILWTKHYSPAPNNVTRVIVGVDFDTNVFITEDKETLEFNGYSLTNGNNIWSAETLVVEWDTLRRDTLIAYGNLYAAGYDGIVYCYDTTTGDLEWTYGNGGEGNSTYAGLNTVYGHYPVFIDVIADGKVYVGTTEHSPDQPLYKGGLYACMNATTGEEIWQLTGMGSGMYVGQNDIVADGYLVFLNIYDMQIYTLGKGPTQLTVDAPAAALTEGQSVVIRGTITDIAAGTAQEEQSKRFPNGVPCVSDSSQRTWMEYVYQQAVKPTDATGVQIELSVIDANGNCRTIGTTTSDARGTYSYQWTPDITGKYTVIATFTGSNAYYGSTASTAFAVDPAAATPAPTAAPQESVTDQYFVPSVAAIIVVIVLVGAAIMLMLSRKH